MATEFKEVTRIEVSNSTDLVVSRVIVDGITKGYHINSYVQTLKYTGFTKGGVFVPIPKVDEFVDMVKTAMGSW